MKVAQNYFIVVVIALFGLRGLAHFAESSEQNVPVPLTKNPLGHKIADFTLHDYLGAEFSLSDWSDKPVVVVAFLGTQCPLAKLYGPRLQEMAKSYADQGVQFVGINSNRQDTLEEIGHYARLHKIEFPILKDPGNCVADQFGAERTPVAYVLDRERTIRYSGRIDDQYGVGFARKSASTRDLAHALDELLDGKSVSNPVTRAVGCFIGRMEQKPATGEVNYAKHIAPIFNQSCVGCHRTGEVAPFALTSYDDVLGWGDTIAEVIRDGRMPPWHANPDHGKFANDARLPDDAKQLIYDWVKNGMPEGDRADLPKPREFTDGWQIGKPDAVYKMPRSFEVPDHGVVPYQYFVLEEKFDEDTWIRAAELRPGNRAVVHHMIMFFVPPDENDPDGSDALTRGIATFAPGMPPMTMPEGHALRVPAGSRLVFQSHYTPNGSVQTDRSQVGLIFADPESVQHEVYIDGTLNRRLKIPAGANNHEVRASHQIEQDSVLLWLTPHMHLRGKSFRFTARYPDGREEILLDVPRYDFNWQNVYKLSEPKRLPAATEIQMVAHYDNSADNPVNPNPAETVRWGDQSWEEMMIGTMALTAVEPGVAPAPVEKNASAAGE